MKNEWLRYRLTAMILKMISMYRRGDLWSPDTDGFEKTL